MIQITVISLVIIVLVHSCFNFLKDNLTSPQVKDMVNINNLQYENIYKKINKNKAEKENIKNVQNVLKDDLKDFMKTLKSESNSPDRNTMNVGDNNSLLSANDSTSLKVDSLDAYESEIMGHSLF